MPAPAWRATASLTQGTFLLAVDVQEFRTINGQEVALGTTRRDIQIVVRACSGPANQPPAFAAATLARQDYQVEEGQRLDFGITATDPEALALTMKVSSVLLDGPGSIEASYRAHRLQPLGPAGVPIP